MNKPGNYAGKVTLKWLPLGSFGGNKEVKQTRLTQLLCCESLLQSSETSPAIESRAAFCDVSWALTHGNSVNSVEFDHITHTWEGEVLKCYPTQIGRLLPCWPVLLLPPENSPLS